MSAVSEIRPLAVVTGASGGIGFELAKLCAQNGFDAMMKAEGDMVHGLENRMQAAMAAVTPESVKAEQHRTMAEPGSGDETYQKPPG